MGEKEDRVITLKSSPGKIKAVPTTHRTAINSKALINKLETFLTYTKGISIELNSLNAIIKKLKKKSEDRASLETLMVELKQLEKDNSDNLDLIKIINAVYTTARVYLKGIEREQIEPMIDQIITKIDDFEIGGSTHTRVEDMLKSKIQQGKLSAEEAQKKLSKAKEELYDGAPEVTPPANPKEKRKDREKREEFITALMMRKRKALLNPDGKPIRDQTITMEKFLGPELLKAYKEAIKEERASRAFRDAVFLESTIACKKKNSGQNRKPFVLWIGGPSASGKTYSTDAAVQNVTNGELTLAKKRGERIDPGELKDLELVVSADGGVEREISQMRQLVLQAALKEGYKGIKDLQSVTEYAGNTLLKTDKIKKKVERAAFAADLNLVIPTTFTRPLAAGKGFSNKMKKYRKRELAFAVVEGEDPFKFKEDREDPNKFKNRVCGLGNSRAWMKVNGRSNVFKMNNRKIPESKKYDPGKFDRGQEQSAQAKAKFKLEHPESPCFVIQSDVLFAKRINNNMLEECNSADSDAVKMTKRQLDYWNSKKFAAERRGAPLPKKDIEEKLKKNLNTKELTEALIPTPIQSNVALLPGTRASIAQKLKIQEEKELVDKSKEQEKGSEEDNKEEEEEEEEHEEEPEDEKEPEEEAEDEEEPEEKPEDKEEAEENRENDEESLNQEEQPLEEKEEYDKKLVRLHEKVLTTAREFKKAKEDLEKSKEKLSNATPGALGKRRIQFMELTNAVRSLEVQYYQNKLNFWNDVQANIPFERNGQRYNPSEESINERRNHYKEQHKFAKEVLESGVIPYPETAKSVTSTPSKKVVQSERPSQPKKTAVEPKLEEILAISDNTTKKQKLLEFVQARHKEMHVTNGLNDKFNNLYKTIKNLLGELKVSVDEKNEQNIKVLSNKISKQRKILQDLTKEIADKISLSKIAVAEANKIRMPFPKEIETQVEELLDPKIVIKQVDELYYQQTEIVPLEIAVKLTTIYPIENEKRLEELSQLQQQLQQQKDREPKEREALVLGQKVKLVEKPPIGKPLAEKPAERKVDVPQHLEYVAESAPLVFKKTPVLDHSQARAQTHADTQTQRQIQQRAPASQPVRITNSGFSGFIPQFGQGFPVYLIQSPIPGLYQIRPYTLNMSPNNLFNFASMKFDYFSPEMMLQLSQNFMAIVQQFGAMQNKMLDALHQSQQTRPQRPQQGPQGPQGPHHFHNIHSNTAAPGTFPMFGYQHHTTTQTFSFTNRNENQPYTSPDQNQTESLTGSNKPTPGQRK